MATAKLIVLKPREYPFGEANSNRTVRTMKMVAFNCPEKQHYGSTPEGVEKCKAAGHDPYFSTTRIRKVREKVVTRTELIDGEEQEVEVVEGEEEYYIKARRPNWEQVTYDVSADSGNIPQRRLAQGWLFPEDLGYAPFCEFFGCNAQNPKYNTPVGNYHLRDEAALMMLTKGGREGALESTAIFVDDDTSGERRRQQLDEMGARFGR